MSHDQNPYIAQEVINETTFSSFGEKLNQDMGGVINAINPAHI